jgi:hypothetical protein
MIEKLNLKKIIKYSILNTKILFSKPSLENKRNKTIQCVAIREAFELSALSKVF